MVACIVNQAVVGKYNALGPTFGRAQRVDVAFSVGAAFLLRQDALIVAEAAAADAFTRGVGLQGAAAPAQLFSFFFW